MTKVFLATVMAGAFLISMPLRAEEKASDKTDKAEKAAKKDAKKSKDEAKKEEKSGGW